MVLFYKKITLNQVRTEFKHIGKQVRFSIPKKSFTEALASTAKDLKIWIETEHKIAKGFSNLGCTVSLKGLDLGKHMSCFYEQVFSGDVDFLD